MRLSKETDLNARERNEKVAPYSNSLETGTTKKTKAKKSLLTKMNLKKERNATSRTNGHSEFQNSYVVSKSTSPKTFSYKMKFGERY